MGNHFSFLKARYIVTKSDQYVNIPLFSPYSQRGILTPSPMNHHDDKILRVAHRGASGYEPENTIRAFRRAIELDVGMIELDVHLCKSGEPVVIHDLTVNRTTNGTGKVSHLSLDELKKLDAGKGEKIPTLQEVIDLTKGLCGLNIEIKNKDAAELVMRLVEQNNIADITHITSCYISPLKFIFKNRPKITTGLIHYTTRTEFRQRLFYIFSILLWPITKIVIVRKAHKARVWWINLARPFAQKNFIKKLHSLNYKVSVWTVNNPHTIKKMRRRGVNAIISDYPERLQFE